MSFILLRVTNLGIGVFGDLWPYFGPYGLFWRLGALLTSELILANVALYLGNSGMIWA